MLVKLLCQTVKSFLTVVENSVAFVDLLFELLVLIHLAVPKPIDLEEHMQAELVHLIFLALEELFKRYHIVFQYFFGVCCFNQPQQMH